MAAKQFGSIRESESIFYIHLNRMTDEQQAYSILFHLLFGRNPSCIDTSNIVGFILNVPNDYRMGFIVLPLRRRHWIAVRKINNEYWNLDSKLNGPERIGTEADMQSYLSNQLKSNDKELFVIVSSEIEKTKSWLRNNE